jgi:hypothetical protein
LIVKHLHHAMIVTCYSVALWSSPLRQTLRQTATPLTGDTVFVRAGLQPRVINIIILAQLKYSWKFNPYVQRNRRVTPEVTQMPSNQKMLIF